MILVGFSSFLRLLKYVYFMSLIHFVYFLSLKETLFCLQEGHYFSLVAIATQYLVVSEDVLLALAVGRKVR